LTGTEYEGESARTPEAEIRAAAEKLAAVRARPCLLAVLPHIRRRELIGFCDAVAALPDGPADVLLASPGGDIDAAYPMARALGRRGASLGVFVPLCAKSAATLIAIVADELVLGPLGELGPIDAQFDRKRRADFSSHCSELTIFRALEQANLLSLDLFDETIGRVLKGSGMTPFDAAAKATELVGDLMGKLYGQIDPLRVGEAARALEVGHEYAIRLLRRYRPEIETEQARRLVHGLVHRYPAHGFALDLEELGEMGLPARRARGDEASCLDRIARALLPVEGELEVLGVVAPPAPIEAASVPAAAMDCNVIAA